jgi:hypothetical protein
VATCGKSERICDAPSSKTVRTARSMVGSPVEAAATSLAYFLLHSPHDIVMGRERGYGSTLSIIVRWPSLANGSQHVVALPWPCLSSFTTQPCWLPLSRLQQKSTVDNGMHIGRLSTIDRAPRRNSSANKRGTRGDPSRTFHPDISRLSSPTELRADTYLGRSVLASSSS